MSTATYAVVDPPAVLDSVLPNGLRIVVARSTTVPTVELRLSIPFGARSASHSATAELLSAMLFTGTHHRSRADIDAELASIGGSMRATADPQWLTISGRSLASGTTKALQLLADALANATYPPELFTAERDRIAERVRIARSHPKPTALMALLHHVFGAHAITEQVPDEQHSRTVTHDALVALHASHVVPKGSVLTIVGNVSLFDVAAQAAALFSCWTAPHPAHQLQVPTPRFDSEGRLVVRATATNADVRLVGPSLARTHPDYSAARLADRLVGGYFLSRLVRTLREEMGYVYTASSTIQHYDTAAMSVIAFATAPATLQAGLAATYDELTALCQARIPDDDEIERARRHLLGTTALAMSTQAGLASSLNNCTRAGQGHDWLMTHLGDVAACNADAVRQALRDYYQPTLFTGLVIAAEGTDITGIRATT